MGRLNNSTVRSAFTNFGISERTYRIKIKIKVCSIIEEKRMYEGDIVDYKGKRYFVSLAEERVEFIGIIKEDE